MNISGMSARIPYPAIPALQSIKSSASQDVPQITHGPLSTSPTIKAVTANNVGKTLNLLV